MPDRKTRPDVKKTAEPRLAAWVVQRVGLFAVLLVIFCLAGIRLRLANIPLERDEGEYAYAGQLILQGYPPYQLAYNMKFPGTYYAYSLIMVLFGQTAWGIHVGLLIINAATAVLLFFLARRLLNSTLAAAIASIAFSFLSVDRWIMGIFGHATHFVVFAAVAGLLMLYKALDCGKPMFFAGAGVLLGLSVLMKQNGIFFLALGIGIAIWRALSDSGTYRKTALGRVALIIGGSVFPFLVLFLALFVQGTLKQFWFWTFRYAQQYVSRMSVPEAWTAFAAAGKDITRANLPIWILAGVGAVCLWTVRWPKHTRTGITAMFILSALAVCPGLYFRSHYFILLLPVAGLLCGLAVDSAAQLLSRMVSDRVARTIAIALFTIVVGAYVVEEWEYLFVISPSEISRSIYGVNPFIEAPDLAQYVQTHSDSTDRIAVVGSEPEIYFYAKRKSATGYIYMYPLMEQQQYSQTMQDETIHEITESHPKYIVYVGIPTSWLVRNPKERILTWSQTYLNDCYRVVGVAEIEPNSKTEWYWDADVSKYTPRSQLAIYTFRAKADTPCRAAE